MKRKNRVGSTLDSLLQELGESEEVGLLAQKKILSIKIQKAMARRRMTRVGLAKAMETSRTTVQRLLDPMDTGVTLATLWRASRALGVKLVDLG